MLTFVPIWQTLEENREFADNPACSDTIAVTMNYYKKIGFVRPWIGYLVLQNNQIVGSAGYKGAPVNYKIEIAYGTLPRFENQGIGTQICRQLVTLAITTEPGLKITARTLPDNKPSMAVLQKNGFELLGVVQDADDGDVMEWLYSTKKIIRSPQRYF